MKSKGVHSPIIKLNSNVAMITSGTGRKLKFSLKYFYQAVKYIMKTFKLRMENAISQIKYYLICLTTHVPNTQKYNNTALKNIYNLQYTLSELFV